MTDIQSKDSQEILNELSSFYGCYGIKTVEGLSTWIDQWLINGGDSKAFDGEVMIINTQTRHMTMWVEEVFNNER